MVMSSFDRHFTATQGLDGVNWKNGLLETRVMRSSLRTRLFQLVGARNAADAAAEHNDPSHLFLLKYSILEPSSRGLFAF